MSVAPILRGFDYQGTWFWIQASRLLLPGANVSSVGLEIPEVSAFDDIVTRYGQPTQRAGHRIQADRFQLKFKTRGNGALTVMALTDPALINADRYSLLERLRDGVRSGAVGESSCQLITSWQADNDDQLGELIDLGDGSFYLDTLMTGGPKSRWGVVRAVWRDHLGLSNDDELLEVLRPLRIRGGKMQQDLDELLETALVAAGLTPLDATRRSRPYLNLAFRLSQEKAREFSTDELRKLCEQEGLWIGVPAPEAQATDIGIRSFVPFAVDMTDATNRLLDLVPHFHERHILDDVGWNETVYPETRSFLEGAVTAGDYHLHFDCHLSITLAAGHILSKAAGSVFPVQREGLMRTPWRTNFTPTQRPLWDTWEVSCGEGPDLAIAISTTREIRPDVERYATDELSAVRRILGYTINGGVGPRSVRDGDHAWQLAQQAVEGILSAVRAEGIRRLHLFVSAPAGFAFYFGQLMPPLGAMTTYEYDFSRPRIGGYTQAIGLPPE